MPRTAIVTRMSNDEDYRKVECIKAIRGFTGLGLRSSKDIADAVIHKDVSRIITLRESLFDEEMHRYQEMACKGGIYIDITVMDTPVRREIAKQVNNILVYATLASQTDVVNILTNLLKNHLPKVKDNE